MTFLKILPMAVVMIAGPQILSAIFLATSENWRRNSVAFVTGAALSITAFMTAAYLLGVGVSESSASDHVLDYVVLVLLLAAAVHTFLARGKSKPPAWMGKLQTASPKFSFRLGFLLLGVFPTDIFTSVAMGTFVADSGDAWWHLLPFLGLTLLLLAAPMLLLLGPRPAGRGLDAEGARLDERELLDRQRDGHRPVRRAHDHQHRQVAEGARRLL